MELQRSILRKVKRENQDRYLVTPQYLENWVRGQRWVSQFQKQNLFIDFERALAYAQTFGENIIFKNVGDSK